MKNNLKTALLSGLLIFGYCLLGISSPAVFADRNPSVAEFLAHCVPGCVRNGGEQQTCNAICTAITRGDRSACMSHCTGGGGSESGCGNICDRVRFF